MNSLVTVNQSGFSPANIGEAVQLSEMLSRSSLVPKQYQGKPEDILVATIWGKEIGLGTLQSLQNIAVINGKPSVYGDAMLALVQASPVCEGIDEHIENEGTPNPSAVCIARRKGRMPVICRFSVEDAKRAGLWGKAGPWSAYPKRMLQMRARGFALRDAFPDVLKGLITAEEAQDYPEDSAGKTSVSAPFPRKAVPANPLDAIAPPAPPPPAIEAEPVVQTSDPIVIADQMSDTVEVIQVEEVSEEELEREAIIAESGNPPRHPGFALMVPGREEPLATYPTIEEWYEAYEALGDKTARAGRAAARTRMTKLRELREANEGQLGRLPLAFKPIHMARYNQRLAALGATLTPEERAAESGQAAAA